MRLPELECPNILASRGGRIYREGGQQQHCSLLGAVIHGLEDTENEVPKVRRLTTAVFRRDGQRAHNAL